MTLRSHEWGDRGLPVVVCLHGITSHGGHFAKLAERLAGGFHVVALDLRGHGGSDYEPPWNLEQHVEDVLDTLQELELARVPVRLLGHSFGGRIGFEVAAAAPEVVERLVLLDPALLISGNAALNGAEAARLDRSYASFEEAIDRRYEESRLTRAPRELLVEELRHHLVEHRDGRFRYRYLQSAVVAAYGEMSREPPPFELVRVPTLVVLGEDSYIPYDHLLEAHTAVLGDELEVVRVPGGHSVLWDALEETVAAVEVFLALGGGAVGEGGAGLDGRGERVDDDAKLGEQLGIDAVREPRVGLRDRDGLLERASTEGAEDLARLRRRPDTAEHSRARGEHGDRLVADRRLGERPRGPVERVLERARDRGVVLRGGDQDRVGVRERRLEALHGAGRLSGAVVVGVVGRDLLQPVVELDLDPVRGRRGGPAQEIRVVGSLAEAAAEREDLHGYPCTSARLAVIRTSSASI